MRILVVEDHADVRDVLREMFIEAGHRVELAADVPGAEAALASPGPAGAPPWDLLLADLVLPGGSGLDLAARAHVLGVRALLCSGHPHGMEVLERRAIPYLPKPFTLRQLLEQVAAVMDRPLPPPRPPAPPRP